VPFLTFPYIASMPIGIILAARPSEAKTFSFSPAVFGARRNELCRTLCWRTRFKHGLQLWFIFQCRFQNDVVSQSAGSLPTPGTITLVSARSKPSGHRGGPRAAEPEDPHGRLDNPGLCPMDDLIEPAAACPGSARPAREGRPPAGAATPRARRPAPKRAPGLPSRRSDRPAPDGPPPAIGHRPSRPDGAAFALADRRSVAPILWFLSSLLCVHFRTGYGVTQSHTRPLTTDSIPCFSLSIFPASPPFPVVLRFHQRACRHGLRRPWSSRPAPVCGRTAAKSVLPSSWPSVLCAGGRSNARAPCPAAVRDGQGGPLPGLNYVGSPSAILHLQS